MIFLTNLKFFLERIKELLFVKKLTNYLSYLQKPKTKTQMGFRLG
jgi:hypothetical protein